MDLTFLIPTRIESEYRLRNLTTVLGFLLSNFDAKILVKEVDQEKIVESMFFLSSLKSLELFQTD